MGRHAERTALGREFGATDVIAERGGEGVERVRELTRGDGTHTVLECVGLKPALETAFDIVRDGGVVSRVGAPQYAEVPMDFGVFMRNVTLTGGVAPARVHRRADARGARRHAPAGSRVRPVRRAGRHRGRLPGHGRSRGAEGDGALVSGWTSDEASIVDGITDDQARSTTLELVPHA